MLRRADGAMDLGRRQGQGVAVHHRPELADELPFPPDASGRPVTAPVGP